MRRTLVLFSFFLLANSPSPATVELEAYIAELVELTVMSDAELRIFAEHLDRDELVNPIECRNFCTAIQTIHHDSLKELLSLDLNKKELKAWLHRLIEKRNRDQGQRVQTKEETKILWKIVPQRISVGYGYVCAVNNEKKAVCWGADPQNQTPIQKQVLHGVDQISAGDSHACILKEDGTIQCFYGTIPSMNYVPSSASFVQVSARGDNTCALEEDGSAKCWRINNSTRTAVPSHLGPLVQLSTGALRSCGLGGEGTVECWGTVKRRKSALTRQSRFIQVSASESHLCALEDNGALKCSGGVQGESIVPSDLGPVMQVSAGDYFTCVLQRNGVARCWGNIPEHVQASLIDLDTLVQISSGHHYMCVVKYNRKVQCWNWDGAPEIATPDDLEVYTDGLPNTCS